MNERIHIIITGERGKSLKLHLARKSLCTFTLLAIVVSACLLITSLFSVSLLSRNRTISEELADLRINARKSDELIARIQSKANAERSRLNLQITSLKLRSANQLASLQEEKDLLLSKAVSELNERSEQIETIMGKIGVTVNGRKLPKSDQNRGGPFIEFKPGIQDDLLYKADVYMETIRALPLGRPVHATITSRFGPRKDPVNSKRGFHEGIDLKAPLGEKIYATAAGVVVKAGRNGSYGKYVEIDHQNGYRTGFGHMKKFFVSEGERVKRGQLIGQVGNTGRSTGAHLHYEVRYKEKPVNPLKFMQVTKLIEPSTSNADN
jgi:murein DD-endopeptidase MepM/ murein hydrolase activator NlpD